MHRPHHVFCALNAIDGPGLFESLSVPIKVGRYTPTLFLSFQHPVNTRCRTRRHDELDTADVLNLVRLESREGGTYDKASVFADTVMV